MTQLIAGRSVGSTNDDQVREPWLMYVDGAVLTVRGTTAQDLPGVALMHGRCSPKSLLDRYRTGGRPPAISVLDGSLRDRLSFVASCDDGRVVAMSRVATDPAHAMGSGEVSVLVEDSWQRLGIGRRLLRHTAAAAALCGYRQLIAYPGTTSTGVQRLMAAIGTTRVMSDPHKHLHTNLPDNIKRSLGSMEDASARPSVHALGG